MKVDFYVLSAGIAGDPYKLLCADVNGRRYSQLFNQNSLLSLWLNRFLLRRRIELVTGQKVIYGD